MSEFASLSFGQSVSDKRNLKTILSRSSENSSDITAASQPASHLYLNRKNSRYGAHREEFDSGKLDKEIDP